MACEELARLLSRLLERGQSARRCDDLAFGFLFMFCASPMQGRLFRPRHTPTHINNGRLAPIKVSFGGETGGPVPLTRES